MCRNVSKNYGPTRKGKHKTNHFIYWLADALSSMMKVRLHFFAGGNHYTKGDYRQMRKISFWLSVCFLLAAFPAQAQLQRTYEYGVVPTENITSLEIQPVLNVLDSSAHTSSTQTTIKAYHVLSSAWNWGAEVPLVRYESPERSVGGLGDIMLALAYMHPESLSGGFGWGARMEVFTPTATDSHLGS